jgi:hypothetical protein
MKLLIMQFPPLSCHFISLQSKYSSTGDSCFNLFVCQMSAACTTQHIKASVCHIFQVLYIFLIKIYTAITIHVDTSELCVLLGKCLGYRKVITEV